MKVCLSSRQTKEYLKKADEIKVNFRDRKSIPNLILDYPEATIILQKYKSDEEINWVELKNWHTLARGNLILCVADIEDFNKAKTAGIKAYFGWTITDYYTLRAVQQMGVCYIQVGASLFFDLKEVSNFMIPIRAVPNVAYDDGLYRPNGINGTWIRPEDLESVYGEYIAAIEFEDCDLKKEQALYRIYINDKKWPGDLGLIISNLNFIGNNAKLGPTLAETRLNCRQKCAENGNCHFCNRALLFSASDFKLKK